MKKKHWKVSALTQTTPVINEDDIFFTSDTETYLLFELTDVDFNPQQANITLFNSSDGSVINETYPVTGKEFLYEISEEAIKHAGQWRSQVVYIKDNEHYTIPAVNFNVQGHLLDTREPALVAIKNWDTFMTHAGDLLGEWEDEELLRQENERQRIENENERLDNYQSLIDDGVVRTKIDENLQSLEAEYAPRLTEVTAQLAQKAEQEEVNTVSGRIDNLVANAGNTDGNAELLDIRVGWDGVAYPTAGDAVRSIQQLMGELQTANRVVVISSEQTKPIISEMGEALLEYDTGKVFFYDGTEWTEWRELL